MRLRRVSPLSLTWRRRRRGRGFEYLDDRGRHIADAASIDRIHALAIPPAWTDVQICPLDNGHIQAIGTDAAERRQYLYHSDWRVRRDTEKHQRILEAARDLPRMRRRVTSALRQSEPTRERVLAAAVRMLDAGSFRIGSARYASQNRTYGLATIRRDHVSVEGNVVSFCYLAKGSAERRQVLTDKAVARLLNELLARRDSNPELLAWRDDDGAWHDVSSADVNGYLADITAGGFTAKDFRTWNATVLMGQLLAFSNDVDTERARRRAVADAYGEVSDYLGNTVAVAKASYVDPRVPDLFYAGTTIPDSALPHRLRHLPVHPRVERAVLRLLSD